MTNLKHSYNEMYGNTMKLNEYQEIYLYVSKLPKDSRLLDIGCGYGVFLDTYWRHGEGIDNNKDHIRVCREKGLNVSIGVAEKIPHGAGSFDCVLLMQVLEHSKDPQQVFREVFRVLKPGGLFVCTTPSYMSKNAWGDITHVRTYSTYGLRNLAIDSGFQVTKLYASSTIGENNFVTRRFFRMLASTKMFPYLEYILYLICTK